MDFFLFKTFFFCDQVRDPIRDSIRDLIRDPTRDLVRSDPDFVDAVKSMNAQISHTL